MAVTIKENAKDDVPLTPEQQAIQAQKNSAADENAKQEDANAAAAEVTAPPVTAKTAQAPVVPAEVTSYAPNIDPLPAVRKDVAQLELVGANRMVISQFLYERGTVYDMTEEDAKTLLRVRGDDGRPMFMRYDPELKAETEAMVRRAPKPRVSVTANPISIVAEAGPKSKIIEIGTEEELIAAGLIPKDAGEVIKGEGVEV